MDNKRFLVAPGRTMRLKDHDPGFTGKYEQEDEAAEKLRKDIERLAKYQDLLYAQDTHALLLILQGIDTAGKDGIIRHVMAGLHPLGTQAYSFKAPSAEELDHDYLWRSMRDLPERGRIGIFNRSYYEEVLVVRVHPEMLKSRHLPHADGKDIWKHRFDEINRFEQYLVRNGIAVLKIFLNHSKGEQKRRLMARIDTPAKNWKFSLADVTERRYWDDYMHAFESALNHTSTEWAPWYVIPADNKWFSRVAAAGLIVDTLKSLNLHYPVVDQEQRQNLRKAKEQLEKERS
jgi:PPK2 family polyphosphate:nucleotide phosphotransferase